MKSTIASEKEKILEEWHAQYFHSRIHSFSKDVHVADVINHLSRSLDHIASVARQEGREEAIGEIGEAMGKPDTIDENTSEFVEGKIVILKQLDDLLAKLTGKEKDSCHCHKEYACEEECEITNCEHCRPGKEGGKA